MAICLKVLCFCILITLTVQENPWKLRHRRSSVNPTRVKPNEIVSGLSEEIQNVGSEANGVGEFKVIYICLSFNTVINVCASCGVF